MAPKTDLDTEALDDEADVSTADGSKSVNYESKYKGLSRKYETLRKSNEKLTDSLDEQASTHEEELARERLAAKAAIKKARESGESTTTLEAEKARLEKELAQAKAEALTAKKLTKYPNLTEMFEAGDLRNASEFATPEEFDKYLERMNKWSAASSTSEDVEDEESEEEEVEPEPPVKKKIAGITPSAGTRTKGGKEARTLKEIEDELWETDSLSSDPKEVKRYDELLKELDVAMRKK